MGPPLQLPLRLPWLPVRTGDRPLRLPPGLVGPRVPAAVRVRARSLQRRLRPVRLPAGLPRCPLRAALPRRQLRASLPRQVSGRRGRDREHALPRAGAVRGCRGESAGEEGSWAAAGARGEQGPVLSAKTDGDGTEGGERPSKPEVQLRPARRLVVLKP